MGEPLKEQDGFVLNAAIGFLSVLLLVLLAALAVRFVYPRIESSRTAEDPILISDVIQLEVLNGCGIPGAASTMTRTLREYGFDVVESGNFDHFNIAETILISRNGNMENATRVANALGIPEDRILLETSEDFFLDATLVIGSDFETLASH